MIAVIQRVSEGEVKISQRSRGKISLGYVILLGVADDDERHVAAPVSGGCGQCRRAAAARPVHGRGDAAAGRHPEGTMT